MELKVDFYQSHRHVKVIILLISLTLLLPHPLLWVSIISYHNYPYWSLLDWELTHRRQDGKSDSRVNRSMDGIFSYLLIDGSIHKKTARELLEFHRHVHVYSYPYSYPYSWVTLHDMKFMLQYMYVWSFSGLGIW